MQQRPRLYNIDTYRSTKQILEELRVASSQAIEDGNVAHMAVTFAVLLVKISEEQAYATKKIIRLARVLFWLTLIIMIILLPPLIQELYEFYSENTFHLDMPDFSGSWDWLAGLLNAIVNWFGETWDSLWQEDRR